MITKENIPAGRGSSNGLDWQVKISFYYHPNYSAGLDLTLEQLWLSQTFYFPQVNQYSIRIHL